MGEKSNSELMDELLTEMEAMLPQLEAHVERLEKAFAKLEADNKRLRVTLQRLADCEAEYRQLHDLRGGSDMLTGHAWDHMRHAGDDARAALKETGDDA